MPPQDIHGNTLIELMAIPQFAAYVRGAIAVRRMQAAAHLPAHAAAAVVAAVAAPLPTSAVGTAGIRFRNHSIQRDTGYTEALAARRAGVL